MTQENLHEAIDTVARDMTAAAAPALRAGVTAQLRARRRSGASIWLGAAAAAASLVVAFAIARSASERDELARPPITDPRVAESPVEQRPTAVASTPELRAAVHVSNPRPWHRAVQPVQASADAVAWESREIPALEPLAPLAFDDIQPAPIEIRPLVMPPLSVPALEEAGL
jgi:hypothetical protein